MYNPRTPLTEDQTNGLIDFANSENPPNLIQRVESISEDLNNLARKTGLDDQDRKELLAQASFLFAFPRLMRQEHTPQFEDRPSAGTYIGSAIMGTLLGSSIGAALGAPLLNDPNHGVGKFLAAVTIPAITNLISAGYEIARSKHYSTSNNL